MVKTIGIDIKPRADIEFSSLRDLREWMLYHSMYCVDVEARPARQWMSYGRAGLDPHTTEVIMLQIGDRNDQFVVDLRKFTKLDLHPIFILLEDPTKVKIGHNIVYDWQVLFSNFQVRMVNLRDTFVQEKVLMCGDLKRGFSLEAVTTKYIGKKHLQTNQLDLFAPPVAPDAVFLGKSIRDGFRHLGDREFSIQEIMYGASDINYTFQVYEKQFLELTYKRLWRTAILENMFLIPVSMMSYNGIPIDTSGWADLSAMCEQELHDVHQELMEDIERSDVGNMESFRQSIRKPDLFLTSTLDINFASSQQIIELCKALDIPTLVKNKDKKSKFKKEFKDSVEGKYLKKYKNKFPIIGTYLKYQKVAKKVSTYGNVFLQHVNPVTGCIHSSYDQILVTGRISSKSPNLQNIPRTKEFRSKFVSKPGWKLVVADYSSQEVRCLADVSKEDVLIKFLASPKADIHSLTASLIFKTEVSEEKAPDLRYLGKIVNFLIPYGGGAHNLAEVVSIPFEEAQGIIDSYYRAYEKIKPYFDAKFQVAMKDGYFTIDPFTMRKSYSSADFKLVQKYDAVIRRYGRNGLSSEESSIYYKTISKLKRDNQNYGIQGLAATMTKIALILVYFSLRDNNLFEHIQISLQVHDEILLHAKEEYSEQAKILLETAMINAGKYIMQSVTTFADANICDNWAAGKGK